MYQNAGEKGTSVRGHGTKDNDSTPVGRAPSRVNCSCASATTPARPSWRRRSRQASRRGPRSTPTSGARTTTRRNWPLPPHRGPRAGRVCARRLTATGCVRCMSTPSRGRLDEASNFPRTFRGCEQGVYLAHYVAVYEWTLNAKRIRMATLRCSFTSQPTQPVTRLATTKITT